MVIALIQYLDGKMSEIRLDPVDPDVNAIGPSRGAPHMADVAKGTPVLELYGDFGTRIDSVKGVGIIRASGFPMTRGRIATAKRAVSFPGYAAQ